MKSITPAAALLNPLDARCASDEFRAFETRLWIVLLILCNLPLAGGGIAEDLILLPAEVGAGEWWRLFTFPFVHVSWYHLGLDAAAFLLLWRGLEEKRPSVRAGIFIGCWAGALIFPWLFAPEIGTIGLCGLSGIAHGLLAFTALEILRRPGLRRVGTGLLIGLSVKVAWEMATGQALLAGWHPGETGVPIPAAHAGGLIGGPTAFAVYNFPGILRRWRKTE